ncbi:aminoglycoside phosphotransferase family protein [Vibrio sp. kj40-1]|uniref:Aminoglycoside phosphotransferase family protein n=1 Tax=Vibrio algarum TaxID=3020714 RepID=A0ABT4YWJ1_9VIBR|nr:aminoglycoside phosphotransferase family protein [Vibrio sp. KJ40-1]MDB1125926.1 aminoglycoside phosphotransferase family protein [Vibrio sp. KJ40-1]
MIYRSGDGVWRPSNKWSPTIHRLLEHLHANGFNQCPQLLAIEVGKEKLSFIEGDTFNYPLKGAIASDTALISAAKMLRKLHDSSVGFVNANQDTGCYWMLNPIEPQEVICHGDFTPYNVALKNNDVVGVFDFDTAHPAPRVWDIAYSVYCWAPFKTNPDDALGNIAQQIQRAKIFCDAYDISEHQRNILVDIMINRLNKLVNFMRLEAAEGNKHFQQNLDDGHHLSYLADIEYLTENRHEITIGLK